MSRVTLGNKWVNMPKGDSRTNASKVAKFKVPVGTPSKFIDKYKAEITHDCEQCVYNHECKRSPVGCKLYQVRQL